MASISVRSFDTSDSQNITQPAITVLLAPIPGNLIAIFFQTGNPVTNFNITDNVGSQLLAGPTVGVMSTWYYWAPSGVSQITATWSPARSVAMIGVEYNNVGQVNPFPLNNTAGPTTSGTASISPITTQPNSWIICGFANTQPSLPGVLFTPTVGNQEASNNDTFSLTNMIVMDNTASVPGAVTCTATLTSSLWRGAGLELIQNVNQGQGQSIGMDYHWGGGQGAF